MSDIFINAVSVEYPHHRLNCQKLAIAENQITGTEDHYSKRTVVCFPGPDEFASGKMRLLLRVVQDICRQTDITPQDIEFIYFCCTLPLTHSPMGGSLVGFIKNKIGMTCPYINLGGHQCSGLVSCLRHAQRRFMTERNLNNILLLTVDCIDFSSRRFLGDNVIQGDAGSGMLLSRKSEGIKLRATNLKTDSLMHDVSYLHHEQQWKYFFAMRNLVTETLKPFKMTIRDIDTILPHYSSSVAWSKMLKILSFEGELLVDDEMQKMGHLFGTDLVIGLQKIFYSGKCRKNILGLSYGVGSSWGAVLLEGQ